MRTASPTPGRRVGHSRLGAVPTVLASVEAPPRQLTLPTDTEVTATAPARREVLPAVVHIAQWLDARQQRDLVDSFAEWALPPAGLRHPRVPTGHLMSVQSVCLGWHWRPYLYSKTADDTDGAAVKALPVEVADLARAAVEDAYGPDGDQSARYEPDAAIINLYGPGAHLGLHQDGEEPSSAPVVTISLGDTCVFRLAGVGRRIGPFTDVMLRSGDLLVFGGPSRRIYHGVPKVLAGTAPDGLGLPPGRLSITVRETGLG